MTPLGKAASFIVYQVIKDYYLYHSGDPELDSWSGVRGEYETHKEAKAHWDRKQRDPDTNATYRIEKIVRSYPACKKCKGSGYVWVKRATGSISSKKCACPRGQDGGYLPDTRDKPDPNEK